MSNKLTSHFKNGKQVLPNVPPLQKISDSVYAVLGMNPGPYSLTGTNTYLVGTGEKRILIDTGEGQPAYIGNLKQAMKNIGATGIQEIIVTHWHHDHLGGVPSVVKAFGDDNIPVRKFMPQKDEALFGGEGAQNPYKIWAKDQFKPIRDGEIISTEGASLQALYTPGHANDHVALLHRGGGGMFTGDNVLGVGTSVFRDLYDYMSSLKKMKEAAVKDSVVNLYTSHGPLVTNGVDKLNEYIKHRETRIAQVENTIMNGPKDGISCYDITKCMYADVPPHLIPPASRNTMLVLFKLEKDGTVQRKGDRLNTTEIDPMTGIKWVLSKGSNGGGKL
eukprot:g2694.t1